MNFKIVNFVFLKKQADLKKLYQAVTFILMITYNMLTQKYPFC